MAGIAVQEALLAPGRHVDRRRVLARAGTGEGARAAGLPAAGLRAGGVRRQGHRARRSSDRAGVVGPVVRAADGGIHRAGRCVRRHGAAFGNRRPPRPRGVQVLRQGEARFIRRRASHHAGVQDRVLRRRILGRRACPVRLRGRGTRQLPLGLPQDDSRVGARRIRHQGHAGKAVQQGVHHCVQRALRGLRDPRGEDPFPVGVHVDRRHGMGRQEGGGWARRRAPNTDPGRPGCGGSPGASHDLPGSPGPEDSLRGVCSGFMSTAAEMVHRIVREHTWMFQVPHLSPLMDLPDVASLHGPLPLMVQGDREDPLWTLAGQEQADEKLGGSTNAWVPQGRTGECSIRVCQFDLPMQKDAFEWFEKWPRRTPRSGPEVGSKAAPRDTPETDARVAEPGSLRLRPGERADGPARRRVRRVCRPALATATVSAVVFAGAACALSAPASELHRPCQQRLVPHLAAAAYWNGPALDGLGDWHADPAVADLVQRLAPRRVSTQEGLTEIAVFARTLSVDRQRRIGLPFSGSSNKAIRSAPV